MVRVSVRWTVRLVLILLLVPCCPLASGAFSGVPDDGTMKFSVTADGSRVGSERYRFDRTGDTLTVERTVEIDLEFFYVTVARYRHRSEETWRKESLQSLESSTDFRGSNYSVLLERSEDGLVLREGREAVRTVSSDTSLALTTWWNPDLRKAERLLDTQYGRVLDVKVERVGTTATEEIPGVESAERFDVSGELELSVWYGSGGDLVKLKYRRGGYTFVHRRVDY